MSDENITWITVNGAHVPVKEGQDKGEAIKEHFASKLKEEPIDKETVREQLAIKNELKSIVEIPKNVTREDVLSPQKTSYDYAKMILQKGPAKITEGTPKQIQLAEKLRSDFLDNHASDLVTPRLFEARRNASDTRDFKKQKGYEVLAQDAVDRNTLRIINTSSSKTIIERLVSDQGKLKQDEFRIKYLKMLRGQT